MRDECQALARVHTRVTDAIAGYEELGRRTAMPDAPLAAAMEDMHRRHRSGLEGMLASRGCEPSPDGSFLALVQEKIIRFRDWIDDLDDDIPARLRRTEERIVGLYDEAIDAMRDSAPERSALAAQRREIGVRLHDLDRRAA